MNENEDILSTIGKTALMACLCLGVGYLYLVSHSKESIADELFRSINQ
jgi:hypothetical protein